MIQVASTDHKIETETLLGKEARVFKDNFFPEAVGEIEQIRGYGSLQAVEIRTYPNQRSPRVRVAFVGQWQLTGGEADA